MTDSEERARRAQDLIDNPILQEVFAAIERDAILAWQNTKTDEQTQRDFSWMMVKSVGRIKDVIQGVVDSHRIESARNVRAPR